MTAISVILPVYNVEKYLARCLDSLIKQTFDDFEVIAINDGATDNSPKILKEYENKISNFTIVNQENKGLSEARNKGIECAKGEYIYFLDSDDAIHPQCLEIAYTFAKENDADLVCFNYKHSDGKEYKTKPIDKNKIKSEIVANPLYKGKNKAQFNVWTKLYKRDFIKDIRFISGINFEDYPYSYEIYSRRPKTVFLDITLYLYTRNEASLSKQTSRPSHIKDYTTGILRICDIYADSSLKEEREYIKIDFLPTVLKHQIGRIKRASKDNKKEMLKLFRAELLELKRRNMISFRGHKLINWLTYQWLLYGKNCNFYFLISKLLNFLPIKKNTIFISNFGGRPYGCNPKYIVEEIFRRNLNYNIYWTVEKKDKKTKSMFPPMIRLVRKKSLLELYLFSRANIIISNVRIGHFFANGFKKKKNQYYIQTWHGSPGMKKIEGDCLNLPTNYIEKAKLDSKNIDVILSSSKWGTDVYSSAFFYDGKIAEIGSPRNDIFFRDNSHIKEKVYTALNIPHNYKIVLYAPTFRDDRRFDCYDLDTSKLKIALEDKFGGSYVVVSKLHPNIIKMKHLLHLDENVIDASHYPDIQELMSVSDVLITDYSSVIFDFMFTRRPAIFYATDIGEYDQERGFYYKLETMPFPLAQNNDELHDVIYNFDSINYEKNISKFIIDNHFFDDGNASQKAVDLLENLRD